jgi:hypothetical protein
MAHQADPAYQGNQRPATTRPQPKAAPGVKIVAGVVAGLLALVALVIYAAIRAFN